MLSYQYQLVRYIHDRSTSEFVNVGVVIFHPETRFVKSCFISKYGRISNFFSEVDGHFLISFLKQFEKDVNDISKKSDELFFTYKNISEITLSILPKDDSAIECSEVKYGVGIDIDSALHTLYEVFVNKYTHEIDEDKHDDKYVWKNVYKKYFDRYEITKNLKPHSVQTTNDVFEFDKSWKNGIWHCYQTLSFDLKSVDNIKNKVYKWSGILNELEKSKEDLHIYFLTSNSSKHKSVQKFIDDTFIQRSSKSLKVSIVKEADAEAFVESVKDEILEHTQD